MVAKVGMKKKLKEGEVEKEGLKEIEEEFVGLYAEMVKTVEEMVSSPIPFHCPYIGSQRFEAFDTDRCCDTSKRAIYAPGVAHVAQSRIEC